jgi:beta-lactamase regulating signal transducer with metallopeptidase domain
VSELLRLILANALGAGLLALAAWAVSLRVRRQALVHGLWVLALVKLVTPPVVPLPLLPEWSLTLPTPSRAARPVTVVIESEVPTAAPGTTVEAQPLFPAPSTMDLLLATEGALPPVREEAASPAPRATTLPASPIEALGASPARGLTDLAPLAWGGLLAGALVVAVLTVLRIRRFRRVLRLATEAPSDLTTRAAELAGGVGLRRAPPVLLLPARIPPMLWPGRRGPLLLMPADLLPELSDEERDALLVHELAHVRRRDHWVRWLELAVTVVFWWYPVAWWVRRALRRAEERCCDEWVLRVMPGSARAYAQGLLKSLDFVAGEPDPLPAGASGAGPVRDLEARLKEILVMEPKPQLPGHTRVVLAAAAALALVAFPTRAQSPETSEAPPALAADELPAAPPAPAALDEAPPAEPALPVIASPPPEAPPAAPAPPSEGTPPAPALPASPLPILATPLPMTPATGPEELEPLVAPEPLPHTAVVPAPAPAPAPAPVVAPGPVPAPAPAPVVHPRPTPAPVVPPAGPTQSSQDEATRREYEEQQMKLAQSRAELHARELQIALERNARELAAEQEELRAEADRLKAIGEPERAAVVEEHARAAAERAQIQRRAIELDQHRMAEERLRQEALLAASDRLRVLAEAGQAAEAAKVRAELAALEQEHLQSRLEYEEKELQLQREVLEIEHRAQMTELRFAEESGSVDGEMRRELERARARQRESHRARQRELEVQEAAQAARARELEAQQHEAVGETVEAEAARAQAEEMRREVEAERLSLQEERLVRASEDLELQMESQLEALHALEAEGSSSPETQERIRRLEAALAALRQ